MLTETAPVTFIWIIFVIKIIYMYVYAFSRNMFIICSWKNCYINIVRYIILHIYMNIQFISFVYYMYTDYWKTCCRNKLKLKLKLIYIVGIPLGL